MGPKTHALTAIPVAIVAAAASQADIKHSFFLFGVALLGTTFIPDGPIFLQWAVDKAKGRPPFSEEIRPDFNGSFWYISKDITHSPLVWIAFMWLGQASSLPAEWRLYANVIGLGIFFHYVIDLFTHTGDLFKRTDQSLIWPLDMGGWKTFRLSNWVGKHIAGWEYRLDYISDPTLAGVTQTQELEFQIALVIFSVLLLMICIVVRSYY